MKVVLVFGGNYEESEITKMSADNIRKVLISLGHDVFDVDAGDGFIDEILSLKDRVDVVFNAMHGKFGEDGKMQAILDKLKIPYTGSGTLGSALTMNKIATNTFLRSVGIKVPNGVWFSKKELLDNSWKDLVKGKLNYSNRLFIKPAESGSSRGVYKIDDIDSFEYKTETSDKYFLVEEAIKGKEVFISILEDKAVGGMEAVYSSEFYDYKTKYFDETLRLIAPSVSSGCLSELCKQAELVHKSCFLRCYSRIDFMVDKNEEIYFIEANSLPGMTEHSIFPQTCEMNDIGFDEAIIKILKSSLYEG